MKVFIATDVTIRICEDKVYARNKYSTIFKRYFNAFGPIILCSRVEKIDSIVDDCDDITDITDSLVPMSSLINGLLGQCNSRIIEAMKSCDLVVCRCPSISAYRAADCAKKLGKPYFTESMGCAWDAYWNHRITGKVIAPYMFLKMRNVVREADYALYVTSEFLQHRYPRTKSSIAASNVLISDVDNSILKKRFEKIRTMNSKSITLMTTAAVNVKYKGQQYVIHAIPGLNKAGIKVKYYIVGEGNQDYLKSVAEKYGVADQIIFTGRQPLDQVFELLDETDIYIQPSLQEGLPRSVIEAMSRGCPAIGARTAGIPELLDERYVVRRKNVSYIERKIIAFCNSSDKNKLSNAKRNFEESKNFLAEVLDEKRNKYYLKVVTELEGKKHAR